MDWTRIGPPADVRPLLPAVRADLLDLLRSLSREDWARPTACPGWTVHHLVGHLVHDHLRKLSAARDGHLAGWWQPAAGGPAAGENLPAFLDRVNGEFAAVAVTLSPPVLVDLLDHFGPQFDALWAGADLAAPGGTDVSWIAPGEAAPVWVDLAREYSEQWVHQQQLRDALERPGGRAPALYRAALDTLVRSLPRALAGVAAAPGDAVLVQTSGDLAAAWTVVRDAADWRLTAEPAPGPERARVTLPADALWRTATRGLDPEQAARVATLTGDRAAGRAALGLLSIIWAPVPINPPSSGVV
jgi:uncharacterized protein (TIGR03083 family)